MSQGELSSKVKPSSKELAENHLYWRRGFIIVDIGFKLIHCLDMFFDMFTVYRYIVSIFFVLSFVLAFGCTTCCHHGYYMMVAQK